MSQLDDLSDPDRLPEPVVEWERRRGPLVGDLDAAVVVIATLGALAVMGMTAAAFLAGRRSVHRFN